MRRLALVRRLCGIGAEQSMAADPAAALAILPLHDAVEMFLQLAAERIGVSERRPEFMQYWSLLAKAGVSLTAEQSMRRLNAARVTLKHQGVLPAYVEVEGFRATVAAFLSDNCPSIFGLAFDSVSMAALVADATIRNKLQEAEAALQREDTGTSLSEAASAFVLTLARHTESAVPDVEGRTRRFSLRTTTGRMSRYDVSEFAKAVDGGKPFGPARKFGEAVSHSAEVFSEAITVVGYQLDFRRYLLFKSYTPIVYTLLGGELRAEWMQEPTRDLGIVAACIEFVVDAALRLGAAPDRVAPPIDDDDGP
jgi:hypothetical protein